MAQFDPDRIVEIAPIGVLLHVLARLAGDLVHSQNSLRPHVVDLPDHVHLLFEDGHPTDLVLREIDVELREAVKESGHDHLGELEAPAVGRAVA